MTCRALNEICMSLKRSKYNIQNSRHNVIVMVRGYLRFSCLPDTPGFICTTNKIAQILYIFIYKVKTIIVRCQNDNGAIIHPLYQSFLFYSLVARSNQQVLQSSRFCESRKLAARFSFFSQAKYA